MYRGILDWCRDRSACVLSLARFPPHGYEVSESLEFRKAVASSAQKEPWPGHVSG